MEYQRIIDQIEDDTSEGIEILFRYCADRFYGYAVERWHCSEDEAWEVVYQTLDKLITKLPECSFSNQSQFDAYIFKVFKSYLSKSYRKKKDRKSKLQVISIEEATEGQISSNELSSIGINENLFLNVDSQNPLIEKLEEALLKLDELDRELLLLRVQNFSYEEIAHLLGIENKQLKVKHHRAKQKLIKLLEKSQILK